MTEIKTNKVKPGEMTEFESLVPVTGEFRILIDGNGSDNGIILVVYAENVCFLTIHSGDGPLAGMNKVYEIEPNHYTYIYLESGRFLNHHGENKGYIVTSNDDEEMSVQAIQLI